MAKSKGVRILVTLECTECRTATAAKNAALESLAIQKLKTEETILKGSDWWNSAHNQQDDSSSRNKIEENIILAKQHTPNNLVSNELWLSFFQSMGDCLPWAIHFWGKTNSENRIQSNAWNTLLCHHWSTLINQYKHQSVEFRTQPDSAAANLCKAAIYSWLTLKPSHTSLTSLTERLTRPLMSI